MAPVSSSKLWNKVGLYNDPKYYETAFVVKLHNFYQLFDEKEVFTFTHPNPHVNEKGTNTRFKTIEFPNTPVDVMIHGFAGYFHASLYRDIAISICPTTFSTDMFSWFPIYFPFKIPTMIHKGDTIKIQIWRNESPSKIWYEWALTEPIASAIHNPNGRSYYIGK